MQNIYAVLCDEIAGTCKNCGLMKKREKSDSPNTLLFDDVHVIKSLPNVPMATGENGCSCVK